MQNKTIRRLLAAAMTAVVAVTSMPLQNVVYAAEGYDHCKNIQR